MGRTPRYSEKGFSFFEIVLVLFIAGMIIGPAYSIIFNTLGLGTNEDRIETIRFALAEHYRIRGHFPMPADITAAPGDADYDDEVAVAATAITTPGSNGSNVLIGAVPIQALREALGCVVVDDPGGINLDAWQITALRNRIYDFRDRADEGLGSNQDGGHSNYRAQLNGCITRHHLLDEFDNKFLYAVSENATALGTFDPTDPASGGIEIVNAAGGSAASRDQWFAIVSHGQDGKGAYDANGNLSSALCTAGINDSENCDNDRIFRSMPVNDVVGNDYFDDRVDFSIAGILKEQDVWYMSDDGGNTEMRFNPNSRLILTNKEDTSSFSTDDLLIVDDGNVLVDEDSGSGGNASAFQVVADQLLEGEDVVVESPTGAFYSNKYCYGPCP